MRSDWIVNLASILYLQGSTWRAHVRDGFYPGYRFPIEVIRHVVWLYHRLCLSLRDVHSHFI